MTARTLEAPPSTAGLARWIPAPDWLPRYRREWLGRDVLAALTVWGYEVDANRELIGLGAANVGVGLVNGMVVNGSLSKTAVNGGAGARSQVSGLVVAGLTILTLLVLTFLFESLPEATLAAIVIAAVVELVDFAALARLYRLYSERLGSIYGAAARADFLGAVAALVGVLVFDTRPGLFIGIFVSILLLLYRASRPHVAALGRLPGTTGPYVDLARHADAEEIPGVVILRPEGSIFLVNAEHVRAEIRRRAGALGTRAVALDFETVPGVDVTAVEMLAQTVDELTRAGVRVVVARDIGQVRDLVQRAGEGLPEIYPSIGQAVAALDAPGELGQDAVERPIG